MSTLNSLTEAKGGTAPFSAGEPKMTSIPAGPRKVRPPHPGEMIADLLDANGISMRGGAQAIGLSPTGFNKVLQGKSPVTPETALRLSAFFGNSPEHWLDMQRACDLWDAREAIGDQVKKIKRIAPRNSA